MKACIVYLVDTGDITNFRRSLDHLDKCESLKPYPIIAFHEHDLPESFREEMADKYGVQFSLIEFVMPDYPDDIASKIPKDFYTPVCPYPFSMGYRHMCRFFSGEIFHRWELVGYKYVLRIDTDSYILDPNIKDPFQAMEESGSVYGYNNISGDDPTCYQGFYSTVRSAVEGMGFNWQFQSHEEGHVFYTNWEIMRMDMFKSELYSKVYEAIDRSGGIFIHRWGDHILRYVFCKQFGVKTLRFKFNYAHGEDTWIYTP